jgi:hypothetical protein
MENQDQLLSDRIWPDDEIFKKKVFKDVVLKKWHWRIFVTSFCMSAYPRSLRMILFFLHFANQCWKFESTTLYVQRDDKKN